MWYQTEFLSYINTIYGLPVLIHTHCIVLDIGLCKCSEHKPKRLRLKTEHKMSTGASLSDRASLQHASMFLLYIKEKDRWEVKEGGQRASEKGL